MTLYQRAAQQPIQTDIKMCDGLFVKSIRIAKSRTVVPQHAHSYDHLSHVSAGAVWVTADGLLLGLYCAGETILIKARVLHRFETVLDNTVLLCIHNADHAEDGEPVIHAEQTLTFTEAE